MLTWLSGKKTYLMGAAGLAVIALWMLGYVGADTAEKALIALGFGGAITLRAAITKAAS